MNNYYERRVYGINKYWGYTPTSNWPIAKETYEIVPWEKDNPEHITEEPLTRREAEAFLKLLRSAT